MNESQARARLERMIRSSDEPTLATDEVADLLLAARRPDKYGVRADTYSTWAASSTITVGDLITPTVRNGHFYEVTASDGTTGTVEPTWPTTSGSAVTADGVTYTEAGVASWTMTWDLNWAAAEGWSWKAGKVAGEFTFSSDRQTFNRSEMHAMCERQRDYYRKKIVGSEPTSRGPWWRSRLGVDEDLLP